MTNSKGYRRGTRHLFAREFRHKGLIPLSTYLRVYRVGDIVSIKGNGAQQKGLPHKCYHGKSGRVYRVDKRGLGVTVNKRVRGKILAKRINVRLEHVKPSRCMEEFKKRVRDNEEKRRKAREDGVWVQLKRQPEGPRPAHEIRPSAPLITLMPLPYEFLA